MRITNNVTDLTTLQVLYGEKLSEIRDDVYYLPRVLIAALTGSGKSTLISKLVPTKMGGIFQSIVGNIRTTACSVQYYFDPAMPNNLIAISASKKTFTEVSDKIQEISMKELANMLVDFKKTSKAGSEEIKKRLFDHIFVSNNSLFNFESFLEIEEISKITDDVYSVFCILNELNLVTAAKAASKSSTKEATLKTKVEELCFEELETNTEMQNIFKELYDFIETVIDNKIKAAFEGLEDYSKLVMCFDKDEEDGILAATEFVTKIFGTPGQSKGLQFFLEEVIVHIPTNDVYEKDQAFVIIDTQGLDHEGNDPRIISDSLLAIINSNRISELLYLANFTSDHKVLKLIEDALAKVKKPLNIRLCLTKFDEYVSKETVQLSVNLTDELDDDEYNELIKEKIIKPAKLIKTKICESIEEICGNHKFIRFNEEVKHFSFVRNSGIKTSKSSDVYTLITEILERIENETEVVAVKRKSDADYEQLVPFSLNHSKLRALIRKIIKTSEFIKSLRLEVDKNIHWSSAYCLKNAVRRGAGHRSKARVYADFAIFPAWSLMQLLDEVQEELLNIISFDFSNLSEIPENLEEVLKTNIMHELDFDGTKLMGLNLSYTGIKPQFEAYYSHYRIWWRSFIKNSFKSLNSLEYWENILTDVLTTIVTKKIQNSISVN